MLLCKKGGRGIDNGCINEHFNPQQPNDGYYDHPGDGFIVPKGLIKKNPSVDQRASNNADGNDCVGNRSKTGSGKKMVVTTGDLTAAAMRMPMMTMTMTTMTTMMTTPTITATEGRLVPFRILSACVSTATTSAPPPPLITTTTTTTSTMMISLPL